MTTSQFVNERKHPRHEVYALVQFKTSDQQTKYAVRNLSLGGICIECNHTLEIGCQIELQIFFPAIEETISVMGEVIWVNGHSPKEVGLRFLSLDPQKIHLLTVYLEQIYQAQMAINAEDSFASEIV